MEPLALHLCGYRPIRDDLSGGPKTKARQRARAMAVADRTQIVRIAGFKTTAFNLSSAMVGGMSWGIGISVHN